MLSTQNCATPSIIGNKLPQISEEEKAKFALDIAKSLSSPETLEHLKSVAVDAAAACETVENSFTGIVAELKALDSRDMTPADGDFSMRLGKLHETVRGAIHDSRHLAKEVSTHSHHFDTDIVPFLKEIHERFGKIKAFIDVMAQLTDAAMAMDAKFKQVKKDLTEFIHSFSTWALEKEGQVISDLQKARREFDEKREHLRHLEGELLKDIPAPAVAPLLGIVVPVLLIGAVVEHVLHHGERDEARSRINRMIDEAKGDIERTREVVERLERIPGDIRATLNKLHALGNEYLASFDKLVSALALLQKCVHDDATRIHEWLMNGARAIETPFYLQTSITHSIQLYKAIAHYLHEYAEGVASKNIPTVTLELPSDK